MTRGRAAIAAAVVAVAMALAGAGIVDAGQTRATQPVVSDRSVAAELDVSGDKAVLVAGDIRRGDDEEQAGHEMSS
ncbi:MAG TPA: hypothetical protein VGC06_24560 [Actinomycetes bacterium]